jgi:hypothetical protein
MRARRPFCRNVFGPARTKIIYRVRVKVKEVNHYGREEEGC